MMIVWYQNWMATLTLLPFVFFEDLSLQVTDVVLLALLGIFCTALAHALFIKSLAHIKTQLASIIACMEPVYGIIFAFVLLGEIPALRTILGGCIILGTIAIASMKRTPREKIPPSS